MVKVDKSMIIGDLIKIDENLVYILLDVLKKEYGILIELTSKLGYINKGIYNRLQLGVDLFCKRKVV